MDTKLLFKLEPYVGAGPVKFGMAPQAVEALLGPAQLVPTTFGEPERNEQRDSVGIRYDAATNGVVSFGFTPGANVVLNDTRILEVADPVAVLAALDSALELYGFLVFMNLGMTLTGYHDDDPAQRALCLFARGRFDEFASQLKPWQRQTRP